MSRFGPISLILMAFVLQNLVAPYLGDRPFIFAFPAIALSALIGNRASCLVATLIGVVGTWLLFFPHNATPQLYFGMINFIFCGIILSILSDQVVRSRADRVRLLHLEKRERDRLKTTVENLKSSKTAIEMERQNLRNLFRQTPEMVCILNGPEHRFEFVNEAHIRALGFDATGKTVREAQPESVEVHGILDEVYRTGKTAELHEIPVTIGDQLRYFNLTYAARRDENNSINGIMILGLEVTTDVLTRNTIQESEAHFRQLVDNSPAILWITDHEARCTYLSRQWYEITGRTPAQDLGFGWVENVHPEDRDSAAKAFFNAVESRGKVSIRYRLRQHDGTYRWAVDTGLPRLSTDGTFLGYIGTVVDVHEQVSSQGELQDLQSRFQRSTAATNLGVWYCDLPFDELIWNKETKGHFFMEPETKVTIQKFYDHIHPDDRDRTSKAIQSAIDHKTPYDINYRTIDPTDASRLKWIRAIGWTDYDKNGNPIRFDGITLDVTKERQHELELKAAKEEAERANSLKSAFLANMSHEIRTPLGALIGFADLLRDPGLSKEEHANYINIVTRNGEQLSTIINDILDLSKVEAGHLTLEFSDVAPGDIIADVVSLLRVKANEKDLALEMTVEPSTPEAIVTDPLRLRQILMNIVGNAIKFTQAGSIKIKCYGCEKDGQSALCFEVTDTGIGIPEEQREKIFDVFVQADGTLTRKFGGTGLGLALARHLARSLGGDVRVTASTEGKGSTFLIAVQDQPARRGETQSKRQEKNPQNDLPSDILDGIRVLVVDDSPDNRQLIWHFLSRYKAAVDFAENGILGYRKALHGNFDVVLMDIQMPEMDGYTATQKLREAGYYKPVIALTAHAMSEVRKKCLNVGCNDHLTKPIKPNELISAVAKYGHISN